MIDRRMRSCGLKEATGRADRPGVMHGVESVMSRDADERLGDLPAIDVIDQLPTGLLLVDKMGVVRYANRAILGLLGWAPHDSIGRSVLDVVEADDLDFVTEIIADGGSHFGTVLGPMRVRYRDASGRRRFTDFWARELDDRSGYVMVVPEESTSDLLADAMRSIAAAAPLEEVIEDVVASLAAHPLDGHGCVLRVDDGDVVPLTPWLLGDHMLQSSDRSLPWSAATRSGLGVDIDDVDLLHGALGAQLAERGHRAMWCRPVVNRRGAVSAVLVVVLPTPGPPSPNQRRRLDEVVSTTALAFDQHDYRSKAQLDPFTDPLTGAGTRARLREEIDVGIGNAAVLYLDLDGFQDINDDYGRLAGDEVLCEVVRRLTSIVRSDDLVIRVGGDEFVLVIRDASELDSVRTAACVVDELGLPYALTVADRPEPEMVDAPASVGLCVQSPRTPFEIALQAADEALSSAKRAGRRRMHVVSR